MADTLLKIRSGKLDTDPEYELYKEQEQYINDDENYDNEGDYYEEGYGFYKGKLYVRNFIEDGGGQWKKSKGGKKKKQVGQTGITQGGVFGTGPNG